MMSPAWLSTLAPGFLPKRVPMMSWCLRRSRTVWSGQASNSLIVANANSKVCPEHGISSPSRADPAQECPYPNQISGPQWPAGTVLHPAVSTVTTKPEDGHSWVSPLRLLRTGAWCICLPQRTGWQSVWQSNESDRGDSHELYGFEHLVNGTGRGGQDRVDKSVGPAEASARSRATCLVNPQSLESVAIQSCLSERVHGIRTPRRSVHRHPTSSPRFA